MRVAHVLNSFRRVSGVETHVLSLATAQKARGLSPALLSDHTGYITEAGADRGLPAAVDQALNPAGRAWWPPPEEAARSLVHTLTSLGAEVIHCHSVPAASQAMIAADLLRIPCVFTDHNAGDMEQGVAQFLGLRFAVISCSRIGLAVLKKRGIPERNLYYVPNGTISTPSDHTQRSCAEPNLILVGTMSERKGVDVALLGVHELRKRRGQACPVLNIYGAGPREPYLREMAAVLGLDAVVRFHGSQMGVLDQCASADVLLLPSRAEASPMVILEAMSRGMPIVATGVGDIPEMLPDPRYGRVIPADSIAALADAVESLLADIAGGRFDPALVIARHRSAYTADTMAERVDQVYHDARLRRARPGR